MRRLATTAILLGYASVAYGQAQQQPLPASTVQLPTFSVFNVTTTVSVALPQLADSG